MGGLGDGDAVVLPGWEHPAAWQLLVEALCRGVATIAFYESNEQSQRFTSGLVARARRFYFTRVDSVLTVGEASRLAVAALGVAPERLVTTHNSIDTNTFPGAGGCAEINARDAGTRFAYVGQLIDRKNVHSLLRALSLCPTDFVLDVIGEGPLAEELREVAETLHIRSQVRFMGYLEPEAVAGHLASVSTLILPSTNEVYGLVPVEALALGRHVVVSSAVGVAADISGMTGVWVTEPSAEALAKAMQSSSLGWNGPIQSPAVLEWTPDRFADDTLRAAEVAVSIRCLRKRQRRSN